LAGGAADAQALWRQGLEESAARADELVAVGDDNGTVVSLRITVTVAQLVNTTLPEECTDALRSLRASHSRVGRMPLVAYDLSVCIL